MYGLASTVHCFGSLEKSVNEAVDLHLQPEALESKESALKTCETHESGTEATNGLSVLRPSSLSTDGNFGGCRISVWSSGGEGIGCTILRQNGWEGSPSLEALAVPWELGRDRLANC